MQTLISKEKIEEREKNNIGTAGLKIKRVFTKEGKDRFDGITFVKTTSKISNPDGSVVFEMKDIEVPALWSQVAIDILAQKYFRRTGIPLKDAEGNPIKDENGNIISMKNYRTEILNTAFEWLNEN